MIARSLTRCPLSLIAALVLILSHPVTVAAQSTPNQPPASLQGADSATLSAATAQGLAYLQGDGVLQNFTQAAAWLHPAAEAGDPIAQNALGKLYFEGLGVEQSADNALIWLEKAAAHGNAAHLFDLAKVIETADPAAAAQLYQQASEAGLIEAAVNLAVLYQDGRGVAQNYAQAHALYRPAAEAGHARAQNNLGLLYVRGHGVAQDYQIAAQLFTAAAQQGLSTAMANLGVLYENGFGVEMDEDRAAALYRAAGQRQDPTSQLVYDPRLAPLSDAAPFGQSHAAALQAGDPIAMFQQAWQLAQAPAEDLNSHLTAAALFRQGAARGHAPSMVNLALHHFAGRGAAQDYVLGHMWLLLAGHAGQPDIDALSAQFTPLLTADQINQAQSLAQEYLAR